MADAVQLVTELTRRGETLAVAESLTGGMLAASVVDVPGASAVLRGGFIVYASDLKATLAGVPEQLLRERGPVDPDVAVALARGARERCGADWGVATTGVAGPDAHGGVAPGTAYVAVAGPTGEAVRLFRIDGDRAAVRARTVKGALDVVLELIRQS